VGPGRPTGRCSRRTPRAAACKRLMPRRRGLRPRLLAAVVRSKATLAFAAERQIVGQTDDGMTLTKMSPPQLTVILALLACPPSVRAEQGGSPVAREDPWPFAMSAGGGITRPGRALIEATFSPDFPGPHLSIGMAEWDRIYGEVGLNAGVTIAAGAGYAVGSPERKKAVHLFVGLPLPIVGVGPAGWVTPFSRPLEVAAVYLYAEPFYRPEWTSPSSVYHDYGVLLKVRVGLTRRQWERRPFGLLDGAFI
jgi:hypothetical protein